jgi:hypothetical protein
LQRAITGTDSVFAGCDSPTADEDSSIWSGCLASSHRIPSAGSIALRHERCSTKTSPLSGRRGQSACLDPSRASSGQSKCASSLARPCHSTLEACAVFLAGVGNNSFRCPTECSGRPQSWVP